MGSKVSIRIEGTHVVLIEGGVCIFDVQYEQALEVAAGIKQQAERIKEIVNHERVILDQAILQRAGMPFGITSNPDIQAEAMKEAHYNPALRRYMKGGVKSEEIVGTPTIIGGENGITKP